MARGQKSKVGDTRVAPNGYHYTCTADGWELTHRLELEKKLKRSLEPDERVKFKDGDRTNFSDPDNLIVYKVKQGSLEKRKAIIESKIESLQAELNEINEELAR